MYFCHYNRTINSSSLTCQNQGHHTTWCRNKVNPFPYDTVLIKVAEDESVEEAAKVIDHFKQISELGRNKNISKMVRLCSVAHSDF